MKFSALRVAWYKGYLTGGSLAMAGDHVEHAITYWVMWQLFQSPLLAGLAVISHWAPHLFFGVFFGSLADRFDCRRISQVSLLLFSAVSLGWAALIATGSLQEWSCVVLLVLHGLAGAISGPAKQMIVFDIAGPRDLASAVRLAATGQNLGQFVGPLIGAALLFTVGPVIGLIVNVAIYLPFLGYMFVLPHTGHGRTVTRSRQALGLRETFRVLGEIPRYPAILTVFVLQGAAALLIGTALLPLLPEFGKLLGQADGVGYGALITAMSLGAVIAGVGLEVMGRIRPTPRLAIASTAIFASSILVFALSRSFPLSLAMLVVAGMGNIVSVSSSQTVVQLGSPLDRRGRFIGAYGMTSMGLRVGSGVIVGLVGGVLGAAGAIAIDASALLLCAGALFLVVASKRRREENELAVEVLPAPDDSAS